MDNRRQSQTNSNNKELYRYAGLGTQLLVAIGLTVLAGLKADKWLHTSPLFTVALPLLILVGIFYKLVKVTGKQKHNEPE